MEDDRVAIGRLIARFFAAVSFDQSGRPDYEALHDLFVEEGLLFKCVGEAPEVTSVDEFIRPRRALVEAGTLTAFREAELDETTEVFGRVAHRFSSYTKDGVTDGAPFAGRGAISTQFVRTPNGWRISAMAWDDERPGLTLQRS